MPIRCLLAACLLLATAHAHAMRCGNRIIDKGLQDFQVRDRCGAPFWSDRYSAIEVIGRDGPVERQQTIAFDVWYYNFGPHQFMRELLFRDGVLVRESTLGYGVDAIGEDCDPLRNFDGASVGELVARCGEPASRRTRTDAIVRRPGPGIEQWRDERREEWFYDVGDERRMRRLSIVDGRVEGAESVER